jgi:hypothetical protein
MDWKFGAASDPNTSSAILETLFQESECWVPLAKNPSTPGHLLEKLSHAGTYQENEVELITFVFGNLLTNPKTSSDAIVRVLDWVEENQLELSKSLHPMEAQALQRYQTVAASNPNTPVSYLREFSKSENETTIFWLGENPSLPKDVIKVFVDKLLSSNEHEKCHTWGQIANNVSLEVDAIERLSKHELYWVREKIARNKSTPERILMELANDDEVLVISGLIWNPNFTTSGFQYLINRVTSIVRNPGAKEKDYWTTYLKNAVNEHKNATEKMREAVNSKDWRWRGDVSII